MDWSKHRLKNYSLKHQFNQRSVAITASRCQYWLCRYNRIIWYMYDIAPGPRVISLDRVATVSVRSVHEPDNSSEWRHTPAIIPRCSTKRTYLQFLGDSTSNVHGKYNLRFRLNFNTEHETVGDERDIPLCLARAHYHVLARDHRKTEKRGAFPRDKVDQKVFLMFCLESIHQHNLLHCHQWTTPSPWWTLGSPIKWSKQIES